MVSFVAGLACSSSDETSDVETCYSLVDASMSCMTAEQYTESSRKYEPDVFVAVLSGPRKNGAKCCYTVRKKATKG